MSETNSTTKKKLSVPCIAGLVLTIVSILGIVYGFINKKGTEVTSSDQVLIYSFILFLIGIVIFAANFNKSATIQHTTSFEVTRLAQAALFAALAYIGFSYFRIDIPVGPQSTAFHLGNTFVVVAALLLGGPMGGLAGAVGLSLADLTSGKYFTVAPQTFFLKLFIGLITGLVAHKLLKINQKKDTKVVFRDSVIASIAGMLFNVIADPVVGFFYKKYILSLQTDLAINWSKMTAVTTFVNAIATVIASVVLYNVLRPALLRANLLDQNK